MLQKVTKENINNTNYVNKKKIRKLRMNEENSKTILGTYDSAKIKEIIQKNWYKNYFDLGT